MTAFIFIELLHSLTEYVRSHRIRVTNLIDASLAFVLREVWLALYAQEAEWQKTLALAFLVLALERFVPSRSSSRPASVRLISRTREDRTRGGENRAELTGA